MTPTKKSFLTISVGKAAYYCKKLLLSRGGYSYQVGKVARLKHFSLLGRAELCKL